MVTDNKGLLFRQIIARIHLLLSTGNPDVEIYRDQALLILYGNAYREVEQTGGSIGHAFRLQGWVPEWWEVGDFMWYVEIYLYFDLNKQERYKQLSNEQKAALRIIFAAYLVATKETEQRVQVYRFAKLLTIPLAAVSIFDPAVDEVCSGPVDYQLVVRLLASKSTEIPRLKRLDYEVAYEALLTILGCKARV